MFTEGWTDGRMADGRVYLQISLERWMCSRPHTHVYANTSYACPCHMHYAHVSATTCTYQLLHKHIAFVKECTQ